MKKLILNSRTTMIVLIILTAIGITVSGIGSGQTVFKMLPLYVSLSVMLFQSEANRFASLIGGVNSILYAVVDYSYGLYASALSDILFSCTLQLATFLLWTKRKDGATTVFRKMKTQKRILILVFVVVVYIITLIVNIRLGAAMALFDAYQPVGVFTLQMLMLFAFIEYTWFSVFGGIVTVLMNVFMLRSNPDRLCYLIFSIYSALCCIRGAISVYRIYKRQNNQEK